MHLRISQSENNPIEHKIQNHNFSYLFTSLKTNNILLDDLIFKANCKIIGVKSKELATAIINNKADILTEVI